MTQIPQELMSNWSILRELWYPRAIPTKLSVFKIFSWKISAINTGSDPGKQILLNRLPDMTEMQVSFKELREQFLIKDEYIKFAKENKFKFKEEIESALIFEKKNSHI